MTTSEKERHEACPRALTRDGVATRTKTLDPPIESGMTEKDNYKRQMHCIPDSPARG